MKQPPYSSSSISTALETRFKVTFDVAPSSTFDVSNVQNHLTDIKYTVTARYDFEVMCTVSDSSDITEPNAEMAHRNAENRGRELLSDAGNQFRGAVQNKLNANTLLYKQNSKLTIYSDDTYFKTVERCHPCEGAGTQDCNHCSGTSTITCYQCNGKKTESCTSCHGSGRATEYCPQCHGSGAYYEKSCTVCYGTGKSDLCCFTCSGKKTVSCSSCRGNGETQCNNCRNGRVTCSTCNGRQKNSISRHVNINVSTVVSFSWTAVPNWMTLALQDSTKKGPADIFSVKTYEQTSIDPLKFVGLGQAVGGEAAVRFNGVIGNCQFIGDPHHIVFLDGIFSSIFNKTLDEVKSPEKIKAVAKASQDTIAKILIKEVELGPLSAEHSSPVKKGIINISQAETFLSARVACKDFIKNSSAQFSMKRVAIFACLLFIMLFSFYLLINILDSSHPHIKPLGHIGVTALLYEFSDVIYAFKKIFISTYESVTLKYNPFPTISLAVFSWFTARFFGPVLFPQLWIKIPNDKSRKYILILCGVILSSALLALHPSIRYVFNLQDIHDVWTRGNVNRALGTTLGQIPQIFLLSLVVAAVSYKSAGVHWATRMYRKLAPKFAKN
jgi:hypothetical protein